MRLDKFICKTTELTRNEAKRLLKQQLVTVNNQVQKNAAFQLSPTDQVAIDGELLELRGFRYFMLHKPQDCICSNVDELYPSVLHYLADSQDRAFELHIAGRLDADTTGLLLITDDGKWSHQISSGNKQCPKTYRVWLEQPLAANVEQQFLDGIQLHGEKQLTKPATLERICDDEVLLTISEGKYHQVKRMFAAVGNKVIGLHREQIGPVKLDPTLAPSQWRALTEQEITALAQPTPFEFN